MNSRERVLAVMQGNRPDRQPFTLTLSLYGAKLTSCPVEDYYKDSSLYLKGQTAVVEKCHPDILFTPFALALEAQAFGSDLVYFPKNPPNVRKPAIRTADDIKNLPVPDILKDPGLHYLRDSTRRLADRYKGTIPICGVLTAHTDLPTIIMGIDGWLETVMFDRENASRMLSLTAAYFIEMANGLFEDGIDFLALPMVFCNPRITLQRTMEEIIIPELAQILPKLKGPVVFHHGGNPIVEYLPLYRDLPNIAGFILDRRDSFREARRILGDGVLLLGNLDGPSLGKMNPALACQKAQAILSERQNDRHFILASSSADIPHDTPLETLTGLYDLIEKEGPLHGP